MTPQQLAASTRPRVEGDREDEILDATLTLLFEVGYDRLTIDAVARRARASKATLYRRWDTKAEPGRRRGGPRQAGAGGARTTTPAPCAAT